MKTIRCDIQLPASKSESNRALTIAAYGGFAPDIQNLSESSDTQLLKRVFEDLGKSETVDVQDCGTAARFMLTFLACHEGHWMLTGTERMQQRPMQDLIVALRDLGADIQCLGKDGFLPVVIDGKSLHGGKVAVDVTRSSQFASSLLLAAPMWPNGLELELKGELNSMPYIDMTINMMRHFGAEVERNEREVVVEPKPYRPTPFVVEPDWSAASYWYEIAALSDECGILLKDLSLQSLQGDAKMAKMAEQLGVQTIAEKAGLRLKKIPFASENLFFDFSDSPDLFPAVVAACAGLELEVHFAGVKNLSSKESDRVEAMKTELSKLGAQLVKISENELKLLPSVLQNIDCKDLKFNAYNDHRIAMALTPLCLKLGSVGVDHPEVVAKSYPGFWSDFSSICQ
ncbi:MAG: 3-phosphoshikimate 1-carboxyvinyltransferase [Bacteroidales bacterium]|nr:3-phosphoshikimate 1-carboxyvinyltransferase [Bacteroidales bacterium]